MATKRPGGEETLNYALYGEAPFGLTEIQHELLCKADGTRTLDALVAEVAAGGDVDVVRRDALVLLHDGGLDFLS